MTSTLADNFRFLRALIARPKDVGAIMPSSPALAEAIAREIDPAAGPVLEIGPGTGVISQAIRIQPVALASNTPFPGPRIATLSNARGHISFTQFEDAQPPDRELRARGCGSRGNEPHVEAIEIVARQMKGINDLRDFENLIDAAAGGGTIRIARG